MNDDDRKGELVRLRAEHRRLDEEIARLIDLGTSDQIALARLKKQKLLLKDRIQEVLDASTPDIIA